MPIKRRRSPKQRFEDLNPIARDWFLDRPTPEKAWQPFLLANNIFDHKAQATAMDLWERHRAELLEEFTQEYPGRRPQYWWNHEAPEPRQHGESEAEYLQRHGLLFDGELG